MADGRGVVLDVQALQSRTFGERGVARYARGLIQGLVRREAPIEALVYNPAHDPPDIDVGIPLLPATRQQLRALLPGRIAHVLSPFEFGEPADLALSHPMATLADTVVATQYDLIPLSMPDVYLADPATRIRYQARLRWLSRADMLLCISEHSRRQVMERLGIPAERATAVGTAVGSEFSPGSLPEARAVVRAAVPAVGDRYAIALTGWEPRKNTLGLIEAWSRLSNEVRTGRQLVVACRVPDEGVRAWRAHARAHGLDDHEIVITGEVTDDVLVALYRAAELSVAPSLAEGFCLPVLEAAACGVAVVTASTTATPEILQMPASTFDPRDAGDMSAVIERALVSPRLRTDLLEAGAAAAERLTWDRVAQSTLDAYARLEAPTRPVAGRAAPRVALVGPYPTAVSGVATYNRRVARRLSRRCELTIFAERGVWHPQRRRYNLFDVAHLGRTFSPHTFDAVVYTLGNSVVHRETLLWALDHPGVVWLHEADLRHLHVLTAQLLAMRHGREHAVRWFEERLRREGVDADASAVAEECLDHPDRADQLPPMVSELSRSAAAVLVSTDAARMVLLRDVPDLDPRAITVVPLALPDPSDVAVHARRPGSQPVIASFGIVAPSKRPEVVIEAFSLAAVPATLAFVGPVDPTLQRSLQTLAERLGIGDAVVFTGHVHDEEFSHWLARASAAIQLRTSAAGEASAALAEAIGAGVPVVTDMLDVPTAPGARISPLAPGCTAAEVAAALVEALDEPSTGRPHESTTWWSFEDVAEVLLEVIPR